MSLARLARWLGPWTSSEKLPDDVERDDVDVPLERASDRPMHARIYRPRDRAATGSLLLVQGLHYAGADDPRMDRFAAILASSGIAVCAPFLPDFARLRVESTLARDVERAFDHFERAAQRPPGKLGVFSISFGSLPALALASSASHADRVGGLVVFGGYADVVDAIRFCLTGAPGLPHDPLNRPVLFINLLEEVRGMPADPSRVIAAWEAYVRRTWGRPEMKARARWEPIAHELARTLPAAERAIFLAGCGIGDDAELIALGALDAGGARLATLDPRPSLAGLRCPVHIVHGRDDDVIPYTQAALLRSALPPHVDAHVWLTGLYAHTGSTGLAAWLGKLRLVPGELHAMLGILRAIHATAHTPS